MEIAIKILDLKLTTLRMKSYMLAKIALIALQKRYYMMFLDLSEDKILRFTS